MTDHDDDRRYWGCISDAPPRRGNAFVRWLPVMLGLAFVLGFAVGVLG